MKNRILLISLAVMLALSMGLVGCGSEQVQEYSLTISSTEGGRVAAPGEGVFVCDEGMVIDLVAEADEGYKFVNWTGLVGTVANVNDAITTIAMNDYYSITANFETKPWDYAIELRLHCTISQFAGVVEYVYAPWIAEVHALTGNRGGKFSINVTYGDAPFDRTTSLSAISSGVVDIGMLSPETFHLGRIGYLPFFFPDMESAAYATYHLWTEGNQTWDRGGLSGVKILITSPIWPMQWWGNVQARTPADLEGVKVHSDWGHAETLIALGATPVDIGTSYPDLGAALSEGIIDGCFFTYAGISAFSGIGANTEYTTELDIFVLPFSLAMNKAKYDSLPAEARSALDSVCGAEESVYWAARNAAGEADDKAATISGPMFPPPAHPEWGRIPYEPTPAELQLWKDATSNLASDWIDYITYLGFDGQGIYDRTLELITEYEQGI